MNGGLAVASTNACDSGSSTTGAWALMAVMCTPFSVSASVPVSVTGGGWLRRGRADHLGRRPGVRDGDRMGRAGNLHHAARAGALGHEPLQGGGDVAVFF